MNGLPEVKETMDEKGVDYNFSAEVMDLDWMCLACQNYNEADEDACQFCRTEKPTYKYNAKAVSDQKKKEEEFKKKEEEKTKKLAAKWHSKFGQPQKFNAITKQTTKMPAAKVQKK